MRSGAGEMHGGIDFERIGMRQGMHEAIGIIGRAADQWRERAEAAERRLRLAEADAAATDAGRLAQLHALRRALETVAPFDPILARTGRVYAGGDPERSYEQAFAAAYDDVGRRHGLPACQGALTPDEWADSREQAVLAEPVTVAGWWLWERVLFRGVQYRTIDGAQRARAVAARQARQALS